VDSRELKLFEVIISYLAPKHNVNLTDLGIIEAASSSRCGDNWTAEWCIDHRWMKAFCLNASPHGRLQPQVKDASTFPTHYSNVSRQDVLMSLHHPRS
jgi:hypothetical protein